MPRSISKGFLSKSALLKKSDINPKPQHGFSLIELLIVIAIIGILASVIMIAIDPATRLKQARDSQRKQDISQISNALVAYETLREAFPDEDECDSSIGTSTGACPVNPAQSNWSSSSQIYLQMTSEGFLKNLPSDPLNNSTFHYRYEPQGLGQSPCTVNVCRYWIGGQLEAPKDLSKSVFRCSDNEDLTDGPGCFEVANFYQ
jgi:prepilin-type N-terminal cleavage/methylation domain-containing protein